MKLRQVYLAGQRFRGLYGPGIFYSTHAARAHASAAARMHSSCFQRSRGFKKTHGSSGMHEPACMLAAAAAAAGRCWLLLLLLAAAAGCCTAAASSISSNQKQPAASSSSQQPAVAASSSSQQQPAWLLHGHAAASKPGCMVHGMLLLQNWDAWCMASCRFSSSSCCVHACVRAWLPA